MVERLSHEQAIVVSAYTGVLVCNFADMHEAVEARMGRPVFTHEFANKEVWSQIKALFKDDFLALVPEEANDESD
jgi:hypothetical protein